MIIKFFDQFIQRKDLTIIFRTPAKQCNVVHNCLRKKSLFKQILKGRMSTSLGQLLVIFIRDQRQMDINRRFPAKCIIEPLIFR